MSALWFKSDKGISYSGRSNPRRLRHTNPASWHNIGSVYLPLQGNTNNLLDSHTTLVQLLFHKLTGRDVWYNTDAITWNFYRNINAVTYFLSQIQYYKLILNIAISSIENIHLWLRVYWQLVKNLLNALRQTHIN